MNALHRDLKKLVQMVENSQSIKEDEWRLGFHLMPPIGWLNDPNGLCWFQGEYHVFFQYAPFDANGGCKCWGHYTSLDMLNWTYRGVALLPDQPFDCHGVYSGSALVEEDGLHLFYTGNVKYSGDYDYVYNGRGANTIYVSSKDGVNFAEKICVMENKDYPSDCTCHVRDPKVWKEAGKYYMVQGARTRRETEDQGEILVFASEDKKRWSLINRVSTAEPFGYMWECPDYFTLGESRFLLFSPQGLEMERTRYQNVYQSGYAVLDKPITEKNVELGGFHELDYGFDFYAPQTFRDNKGRRILIGWAGMPDSDYGNPTVEKGWQHCLTVPRVLACRNGKLYQNPVEELQQLRNTEEAIQIEENYIREHLGCFEVELEIGKECQIQIGTGVTIQYKEIAKELHLVLSEEAGAGRGTRILPLEQLKDIHILADTSCLELYINQGEFVMTTRYYEAAPLDKRLKIKAPDSQGVLWELRK